MMRLLPLALLLAPAVAAADNIAACEVVTLSEESEAGFVASYHDASTYIAGLADPEIEGSAEVDGRPVRALLCRRASVVPSVSDLALITEAVPLSLSTDFDAPDSAIASFARDADGAVVLLKGDGLSASDRAGIQACLSGADRPSVPGPE